MATTAPTKFTGWVAEGPDSVKGNFKWTEFTPKAWTESDVDIKVTHSGLCSSDLHTASSGWAPIEYPCVVGHEIVGTAVRVGSEVKGIKVGDRVGAGPIVGACDNKTDKECKTCAAGQTQFCPIAHTEIYNSKFPNGDKSQGGHAEYARAPGSWVFKIPDGLKSEHAAPMLCAGVTTYRPLKRNGCGPGKRVGIIGIGGLGHFGLLWAKALGADEVVAVTRSRSKDADAKALGADRVIATSEEGWEKANSGSLDLILSTVSEPDMPLSGYLSLLSPQGHFTILGAPEGNLPILNAFPFIAKGISFGGSLVGSYDETVEMLEFAAKNGVEAWVNVKPMSELNTAVVEFRQGKPRYRFVFEQKE